MTFNIFIYWICLGVFQRNLAFSIYDVAMKFIISITILEQLLYVFLLIGKLKVLYF